MLLWFYRLPLWFVITGIITVIAIWAKIAAICVRNKNTNRIFKVFSYICLLFSATLIIYATLIGRPTNIRQLILMPFQSFIDAQTQPEMYRTMLMNVTLFTPLGFTLGNALPQTISIKARILLSTSVALLASIAIEFFQYVNGFGLAQTDDVLCNAFGAFWGSTALLLQKRFQKAYFKNLEFI